MQSISLGNLATFQVAVNNASTERNNFPKSVCHCKREWLCSSEIMEVNSGSSHSNDMQPLDSSTSASEEKSPADKDVISSVFVNHAAISWHDSRRKWVGDHTQRSQRMVKDQLISWSTTYEDLLSTHEPFAEPIPLTEMVDFLVDIWHDEGLFD